MNDTEIYRKTEAGILELRTRQLNLPQRLRAMLIMVDGTRATAELRHAASTLGLVDDFASTLLAQGLIELDPRHASGARAASIAPEALPVVTAPVVSDSERFRSLQKYMNDQAVDLLGLRAFTFTLKLERCFSAADVLALLPELTQQVAKRKGLGPAKALEDQARRLLT